MAVVVKREHGDPRLCKLGEGCAAFGLERQGRATPGTHSQLPQLQVKTLVPQGHTKTMPLTLLPFEALTLLEAAAVLPNPVAPQDRGSGLRGRRWQERRRMQLLATGVDQRALRV